MFSKVKSPNLDQWWGYHAKFGWVVLDRRVYRNSLSGRLQRLVFVRCSDWSVFSEDRSRWEPPLYSYAPNYLKSSEGQGAVKVLEKYKQQFLEQRSRLSREARNFEAYQEVEERILKEQLELRKQKALEEISQAFETDFLQAYNFYNTHYAEHVAIDDFETARIKYVQSWINKHLNSNVPDAEQAVAIGAVEGHVQVVARAGSGKTTTLIQKAVFLQKHCGISPDQMLLLAFNKSAAEGMREKLEGYLQGNSPNAMTFHALAYGLIHPEKVLVDEPDGEQQRSRVMQNIIDEYIKDPQHYNEIRTLMMKYFREDWEAVIEGDSELTEEKKKELVTYRRSLPRRGIDGTYLKSRGEKVIADFLFEHGVAYKYERNFWWSDGTRYRPDFTIGDEEGVVIEYFGIKNRPDYDKMTARKREYWHTKKGWNLLELSYKDFTSPKNLQNKLKQGLENLGVTCPRLSDEELWQRVNAEEKAIYKFTKVVINFIGRCCKLSLSPEQLKAKVANYACSSEVEVLFLPLVHKFYRAYLERLKIKGKDDFDILIQKATEQISSGQTLYNRASGSGDLKKLRYVLIDEYQDFSDLFYRLIEAIRGQNPNAHFFCVGDDWQAINGFAGSDLNFYQNFEKFFQPSRRLHVVTNYRSVTSVVDAGNALMRDFGKAARAHKKTVGEVVIADLKYFFPTSREQEEHGGDVLAPALLRLVSNTFNPSGELSQNKEDAGVVLLNRKNYIHWYTNYGKTAKALKGGKLDGFVAHLKYELPKSMRDWVSISTAHRYKGGEKDTVIVLDAVSRSYPLIHPDGIFTRILGDEVAKTIAEERRLFYVALTRAVKKLVIITDSSSDDEDSGFKNVSPFLEELLNRYSCPEIKWNDYPPLLSLDGRITVKVGNSDGRKKTQDISGLLGRRGEKYTWAGKPQEVWYKSFPTDGFSPQAHLERSIWVPKADGVTVKFYDDREALLAAYTIVNGKVVEHQEL